MLFAIDIDGTIAQAGTGYARYLNQALALDIPDAIIDACTTYRDFAELPSVRLFRADPAQRERFKEVRDSLEHDSDMQRQLVPIAGAVDALNEMASDGARIVYVTCRKPEAERLTRAWLAEHGFPYADSATMCAHYHYKYLAIHEQAAAREPVVLIDDRGETMLRAFGRLARLHSDVAVSLVSRLAVVAFDADEPPAVPFKVPFPVLALPSWQPDDLARLDAQAEQAFARRAEERRARRAG